MLSALADPESRKVTDQMTVPTSSATTIVGLVESYLKRHPGVRPAAASFACAGPIMGDTCALTNAHIRFSIEETRHHFAQVDPANRHAIGRAPIVPARGQRRQHAGRVAVTDDGDRGWHSATLCQQVAGPVSSVIEPRFPALRGRGAAGHPDTCRRFDT